VIKNRWVFKKKFYFNGNVIEYKSRLVAKEFTQKYGIDYLEKYTPVAKLKSIRALTAFCAANNLTMLQDNVPCAFLKQATTQVYQMMKTVVGWNSLKDSLTEHLVNAVYSSVYME